MPIGQQEGFPTIEEVMTLARSLVNDTFPGIAGAQGRILTDNAPFTLPFLNSAFRTLQRKLRISGVTFPTKDNVILTNVTPVVTQDPNVQIYVGYNGFYDGTTMHPTPKLPGDLVQPYVVWEQPANSGLPFVEMGQPQEGLPSIMQGPALRLWEWRNYKIYMVGSTQAKNLRLRYRSGQPPLDVPPEDFATTSINILDCQEALANFVAAGYAQARGAQDVSALIQAADDAIDDMVSEWVRRGQTINSRRQPYRGTTGYDGQTGGSGQVG
jgi:hypothetical protein